MIASPMARVCRSPIARRDSQSVPRSNWVAKATKRLRQRVDRKWCEEEPFAFIRVVRDAKAIAGQSLATDDLAQIVGKMFERREAAGFGVQMRKIEAPAAFLPPAMLAHKTIEPALQPAAEREIRAVDGQNERVIKDAARKTSPAGSALARADGRGCPPLLPFVDPGEAMPPTLGRLADRGRNRGRLQTVECRLETM